MPYQATSTHLARFHTDMTADLLLVLFATASIAMLCCALSIYIEVWKMTNHPEYRRERSICSVFRSNWFFYMNASVSVISLICLIMFM